MEVDAPRYAAAGLSVFPVTAAKNPLTTHGFKDATTDPAQIEAWLKKWPHCEFGWAVPADVVVVDVDVKHGKRGYDDFQRLAGCAVQDVPTPMATTPSGGAQLFYAASKPYKNAVAIAGTGIDTRSEGGYVVLPTPGNGREWRRPLVGEPLLPAPAWLDSAVRPAPRPPLTLAPPPSDIWAQRQAQAQLDRACAKIAAAPHGAQDATRHAQCFFIGGLIARGDLDYAAAYERLCEAARAMPAYRDRWRNLEERVARSIEAGMERPLALSEVELWMRNFRARMRLKRPTTGAHHG
jgi:Bifunctional DNA primase/polymerase, N-terminal